MGKMDRKPRKNGRPDKFKVKMLEDAEALGALGLTQDQLAVYWGVDPSTVRRWKRKNPELCTALEGGKQRANITVSKKLFDLAKLGDMQAIKTWLYNRAKDQWGEGAKVVVKNDIKNTINNRGAERLTEDARGSVIKQYIERINRK